VALYGVAASYGKPWVGATFGLQSAWWFGNTGSFWTFAILIAVFFRHQGLLSRFMGWKPVVFLGDVSFALYLVHQPVINYLARESPWFPEINLGGQVILFVAIVLGISAALHLIVEKPCMSLAKRLILRPQRLAAA
jgi:peptidoglycan/LPS O-acetylase OafA/YrhL